MIPATHENFYEAGYLAANPEVARAVAAGAIKSGKQHFEEYGAQEGRMQWALGSTLAPGERRIHPLSAHPQSAIWHQLQHSFVNEPELPKPLLEPNASMSGDIAICARVIDAFSRAIAYEQDNIPPENRPNDGVWETLKITAHSEAYRLLASKDAAGLADYLRNGLRTTLCSGLGPGPVIFQKMSGPDWRDPVLQLVDGLAALAEAIGALPYENPVHGQYGQNIHLAIPELTDAIERKLRFPINRPKVMGNYGIDCDCGVIDFRVPDDAYCAHRIRLIRDDISNTGFIEIGGGFGGMALFALRAGATRWPIVDLPIMNVVQGYFLIKCLGGNMVRLFGENNPAAAVEALPYWEFFDRARDYSVVFNRNSLPEIQRDRVDEYLAEIETRGANLLSINHEAGAPAHLNLHQIIAERGKLECHFRHPYWIRKGYVEESFTPSRR
jgi:hypothetical protein